VRKPVTALDCVLLKDRNLALAHREGPEISSRACLWVSPRPRHLTQCWLNNQQLILLRISCLETPRAGSGPTNCRTESPFASSSAISLPRTPARLGNQYDPTVCRAEISFNAFWHCWTNRRRCSDGLESIKAAYQSRYVFLWSILKMNFINTRHDSKYTGSLFYLKSLLSHIPSLLVWAVWVTLIHSMSRQEVATHTCQIK
jgi:hypothetical protein